MDTGDWKTNDGPFPPNVGQTDLQNIGPGAVDYAKAGWWDMTSLPVRQKIAYPDAVSFKDTTWTPATWQNYVMWIDYGKPVLCSFDGWVDQFVEEILIDDQEVVVYSLATYEQGHTVCGVGYDDPTPDQFNGDEMIIAQDNWPGTPKYVGFRVPAAGEHWVQNDYIEIHEVFLSGDLNQDGFVGQTDLDIVLAEWGNACPLTDPRADPNGDCFVGQVDLDTVLANWGAGTPPPLPVPEPATISLVALAGLALAPRRR